MNIFSINYQKNITILSILALCDFVTNYTGVDTMLFAINQHYFIFLFITLSCFLFAIFAEKYRAFCFMSLLLGGISEIEFISGMFKMPYILYSLFFLLLLTGTLIIAITKEKQNETNKQSKLQKALEPYMNKLIVKYNTTSHTNNPSNFKNSDWYAQIKDFICVVLTPNKKYSSQELDSLIQQITLIVDKENENLSKHRQK